MLGPVAGFFGEASPDIHDLRDLIAQEQANKRSTYVKGTVEQSFGLYKHQLNRKWGHIMARGWARLILNRLRDHVRPDKNRRGSTTADAGEDAETNEAYNYFNPNDGGGGFSMSQ